MGLPEGGAARCRNGVRKGVCLVAGDYQSGLPGRMYEYKSLLATVNYGVP